MGIDEVEINLLDISLELNKTYWYLFAIVKVKDMNVETAF